MTGGSPGAGGAETGAWTVLEEEEGDGGWTVIPTLLELPVEFVRRVS